MKWTIVFCLAFLFTLPLSAQKWERLTRKVNHHFEQSDFSAAMDDALRILEYSVERLDSTDSRYTLSHFYVAKAYASLGDPGNAKPYIQIAYGLMLPNIAYTENMAEISRLYGEIETDLGYHRSAERLLNYALDIGAELDGPESLPYLLSLYALADLEMARARWDEMLGILTAALQIHERNFPLDQDYAVYANYLGLLFMNSERRQEAILYFGKSLSAYQAESLPEDLTCANAHNNLGLIYYYQSEFEDAAMHFEHAGTIYPELMEGYSENYMMLLSNQASLYYSWGKTGRMEESYKALGEYLENYDERVDLPYIQGVENMAGFHASDGNFEKSEACFLRAIEARKSLEPLDSEGLMRTIQTLISVCEELNQTEKARYYRKMAEQIMLRQN